MNINELLKGTDNCQCGQPHHCNVKEVYIDNGAVNELKNCITSYQHIVVVADQNTYKVAGEDVINIVGDKLSETLVYQSGDHFLVPNEEAVEELEKYLNDETDLIIGIGSGVINDICKYVSFNHHLPYMIVATAPSMDGYASDGAAMIMNKMKITYSTHVPIVIIGDVDYLKTAPKDMLQSGYGDIIGKYSALNDWKLSHVVNDEYICDYVYNLTLDMVKETLKIADGILTLEDESIKVLMEALVVIGIAMSFVGNSRPASGSEHHLSHFFEIVGLLDNKPYFNHGVDVIYSAYATQRIREKILLLPSFEEKMPFNQEEYEDHIHRIYTEAADGIIELQNKAGWYQRDYISIYKDKYNEIIEVLDEAPKTATMIELLDKVDLHLSNFLELYGVDKIQEAMFIGKDLKTRYSVLWLFYTLFYDGNKLDL